MNSIEVARARRDHYDNLSRQMIYGDIARIFRILQGTTNPRTGGPYEYDVIQDVVKRLRDDEKVWEAVELLLEDRKQRLHSDIETIRDNVARGAHLQDQ